MYDVTRYHEVAALFAWPGGLAVKVDAIAFQNLNFESSSLLHYVYIQTCDAVDAATFPVLE